MYDTWGISGPVFAGLYLGLLLVPAVVTAIRLRTLKKGRPGAPERDEELALLTGGRGRLVDFAVAKLLAAQKIRIDTSGQLHRISGKVSTDLERRVVVMLGRSGTRVHQMRRYLEDDPGVAAVERPLIARGLLTDPRKLRLTWVFAAVAWWALIALGVARLIAGTATGHPVGFLLALLVVGTGAAVFAIVRAAKAHPVEPTATGRAAAAEAAPSDSGAAGAVAKGGFGAHPDRDVRLAVSRSTLVEPSRSSGRRARAASAGGGAVAGYYGGSGGCGGVSSCGGGGSSCGGGGGGCGG